MISSFATAHPNTRVPPARPHLLRKEESLHHHKMKQGKGHHRRWYSESSLPLATADIRSMDSPGANSSSRQFSYSAALPQTATTMVASSSSSPSTGHVVASFPASSPVITAGRRKNQVANNAVRSVNLATMSPASTTTTATMTPPDSPAANDDGLMTKKFALLRCQVACREGDYHSALASADELLSSLSRRTVDKKQPPIVPFLSGVEDDDAGRGDLDNEHPLKKSVSSARATSAHFLELAPVEEVVEEGSQQQPSVHSDVEVQIRAEVLGCKRFALMKLSRFQEAASVLEESASLRKKHVRHNSSDSFFGVGTFDSFGSSRRHP